MVPRATEVVVDSLEAELDGLFRLAPSDMVESRNALADRLKKMGDKAAAAQIKALKRPTPAAWAINQVFFEDAALLERARAETLRLRELHAQDGVELRLLSAAVEAQRTALQAAVEAAIGICARAGSPAAPPQQRKIFTTLQGWLAGTGAEAPGRMTHDIEPSGFDALAFVGETAPHALPEPAPRKAAQVPLAAAQAGSRMQAPAAPLGPDPRELEHAAAKLAELEQRVEAARAHTLLRRSETDSARQQLERTQSQLIEAERILNELRAELRERDRDLTRRNTAFDEAEQAQQHADAAAARARAELAALRRKR